MKLKFASALIFIVLCSTASLAQGCAMCSLNAQAAGKQTQRALVRGVKVLLVPPVLFMGLIVGAAFIYKKRG